MDTKLSAWKYIEMDYGHDVRNRFFILIGTSSFHIFEWFRSSSPVVNFMFPATKDIQSNNLASFMAVHRIPLPHFRLV